MGNFGCAFFVTADNLNPDNLEGSFRMKPEPDEFAILGYLLVTLLFMLGAVLLVMLLNKGEPQCLLFVTLIVRNRPILKCVKTVARH